MGNFDLRNTDCMELMKEFPENHFDIAIVDPPYGINAGKVVKYCTKNTKTYNAKDWDSAIPDEAYFTELFRVSKNQIIWGGNYYANLLPNSRGWIYWNKVKYVDNYADGELAWTSFDKNIREAKLQHHGFLTSDITRIHPTQKPVRLYAWLLENYAEKGCKVLDTHLGSGSIAIACHYFGCHITASEIDKEYYLDSLKRIKEQTTQLTIF